MKKSTLCLLLLFWSFEIYSQVKNYISIETDANYYYYFYGKDENFNYGFSMLISVNTHKLKVSSGISYSIKSINSKNQTYKHKLDYLNFPIIANIEVFSKKKISLSIPVGFIFNHILAYNITTYYSDGKTTTENNLWNKENLGITFVTGVTFSKLIGNRCRLNLSPFFNCKLILEFRDRGPYGHFPEDRLAIGFKIGIEYLFKKYSIETKKKQELDQKIRHEKIILQ